MTPMREAEEPTELIYPPSHSWLPALSAAGLAGLVVGLFAWWPYAVIGGAVAVVSLIGWLRGTGRDMARLPRKQPLATAPIPLSGSTARSKATDGA
jgi:hypothetical protein